MYIYPYKRFCLAYANKRLFNVDDPERLVGIYDIDYMNFKEAFLAKERIDGSYISVLLGEIKPGVYLNCIDLDGYKNEDGSLSDKAKELLKNFSKEELEDSISGAGGHIFFTTRKKYKTFKIKEYFGKEEHRDLEIYADKRYIVTTTLDFSILDLPVGKYDNLIDKLYKEYEESQPKYTTKELVLEVFEGKEIKDETQLQVSIMSGRTPVTDMHTLRGCGYKDTKLIELIDAEPSCVNQSDHDASLLKKLMYYTLSFESAYEMAKKTNYYQHKDDKHKKKFNNPGYILRTRRFLGV